MRIGIDIDDTVAKTNDKLIAEAIKYDMEKVKGRGFKNKNAYSFMEMFYWSVLDVDGFLKEVRKGNFFLDVEPIEDSVEMVNKLFDEGNQIVFITKRKNTFNTKMKTKKWLKKCGFKFNKVILGAEKKGEICDNIGIDLFVDNDLRNIYDAIDYGIDSILMGDPYNKNDDDVRRMTSWKEVYKYASEVKANGENSR